MFNLEQAIAGWRKQMTTDGLKSSAILDELENHLREQVQRDTRSGTDEKQAFCAAVERLGPPQALTTEFAKVGETNDIFARIKDFFLILAGIPDTTLAVNSNTSSNRNIEPAWATYVRSITFVLPAAFLWLFVAVIVFPKFNEIVSQSAIWTPGFYREAWFRMAWNLAFFMAHYAVVIGGGLVLAVLFLEWRSNTWSRYRRTACGIGVLLLNSIVLISITALVVIALTVAPVWGRHMMH